MIKTLTRREDGIAMILVLIIMALAIPVVGAGLGLAGTLSVDSRVKTQIVSDQYCSIGGGEHALYRLLHDQDYIQSLLDGIQGTYTIVCNGKEIQVGITKFGNPPAFTYPSGDNSRRLQTLKEVTPDNGMPDTLNTFTYTITVINRDDDPESLDSINDLMPTGFNYIPGSTTGVTTDDPSITLQLLTWDLVSENIILQPGESRTLSFQASANVSIHDNYCNEAWAEPGGKKTSTGATARIEIGFPFDDYCPGAAVKVTKSVTPEMVEADTLTTYEYTVDIENIGRALPSMTKIEDLLPAGFSYVPGSAQVNSFPPFVIGEPTITTVDGREHLKWSFMLPKRILPGMAIELVFNATATAPPGDYYNEAWVTFINFPDPVYTWPTARVMSMAVIETEANDSGSIAYAEIWIGTDTYIIVEGDYVQ
jgi:uncharacterized repeat protein (TIGR01451 family)